MAPYQLAGLNPAGAVYSMKKGEGMGKPDKTEIIYTAVLYTIAIIILVAAALVLISN